MIGTKKKRNDFRSRGFSLIELLVSISIIALLTGIFLSNYHSAGRRTDLTMTAQTLVTDIHFAQANALGLVQYDGATPAGGWGIALSSAASDNNHYLIFADENNNQRYDDGEAAANLGGRQVNLPDNIVVDNLSIGAKSDITFLPPDPITTLRSDNGTSTVLDIRLKEKSNNTIKTIRINFLGLVEVID